MIKLLRTIRFDASDDKVFAVAAVADDWAVSGSFVFADAAPDAMTGKTRQAFANGFLGIDCWGWSTFATVSEATDAMVRAVEERLADHFVEKYGAPSRAAALPAAQAEIAFVIDLCHEVPINTVFTVRRVLDEQGRIKEEFRTITPPSGEAMHARIWRSDDEA
jgi:Family of unknown function (DUF6505)